MGVEVVRGGAAGFGQSSGSFKQLRCRFHCRAASWLNLKRNAMRDQSSWCCQLRAEIEPDVESCRSWELGIKES